MSRYKIVPISLKESRAFQDEHHRHNVGAKGHKFSIGLEKDGQLVGCATCGRPVSRKQDDGKTLEITRVCIDGVQKNANSMLYGACVRAGKAMGYTSIITYTLLTESGASLKAAGFESEGVMRYNKNGWDMPSRPRQMAERYPAEPKIRWRHY